jgi:hypothetical protein
VKTSYAGLSADHRATLDGFNIQKADWELMQKIEPVISASGINHLTPNLAYGIPREDVAAMLAARGDITPKTSERLADMQVDRYKDDLARRLWLYLQEGSRNAINAPGEKVKRFLGGIPEAHNPIDAAKRTMWQLAMFFKQWPAELIPNTYARAFQRSDTFAAGAGRAIGQAVALTGAGYMALAVAALKNNQEPPDPTAPMTLVKAALKGGAGTLLSDITGSELIRQGSLKERLGGFVGGIGVSQVEPVLKVIQDGLAGKDMGKSEQRLFKDQMGFTQAWYSALATNYFFLWHLYDTMSPGWAQQEEQQAEQYGKPYGALPFTGEAAKPTNAVGQ